MWCYVFSQVNLQFAKIDKYIGFVFFMFTEQLSLLAPSECPHLILQALAGPMAAATASTITNPMDVVRARVQVKSLLCTTLKAYYALMVYYMI